MALLFGHMVFPATPLAWAAALSTQSELDISQTAPFVLDCLDCLLVHSVWPPREAADFFTMPLVLSLQQCIQNEGC